MVHGGSQTGTNFTGTPDGREGWAQYFLRRGYAVYVVDQVARGRSAHFSQSQGAVSAGDLGRTEQRFVAPKRFNLWPQAKRHTQWPGSGKPGDGYFDAFYATQFPSLVELSEAAGDQPRRDHRAAREDRPRGAAGAFAIGRLRLADRGRAAEAGEGDHRDRAERAAGLRDRFQGRAGLVRRHRRAKDLGLGMVPIAYDPPLKSGEELVFVRQDKPDAPDLVRGWLQAEPARKLPNLAKVPMLILVAEASYHAAYDHCTAAYLTQAGVPVTIRAARGCRHPRQRPHDDAGKEQRRNRRRDDGVAEEGAREKSRRAKRHERVMDQAARLLLR